MMNIDEKYRVVRVDFREQINPPVSGFDRDVSLFLGDVFRYLNEQIKKTHDRNVMDARIAAKWFELMGLSEFWETDAVENLDDVKFLTGLNDQEINLLKASAAAEIIGMDLSALEKSAAQYNIYGPNFPGRARGGLNLPYRGDLSGDPSP